MRGVYLEKDLIESAAFRSLTRWSVSVLLRFYCKRVMVKNKRSKRGGYSVANNGEIVFPYREAEALGIGPREFRNALDQLQEVGFLDIEKQGVGGRSGDATLYRLDERWRHYGTDKFQKAKKPRVKDTRQGRGWTAFHARQETKPTNKIDSGTANKIGRSSGKNGPELISKSLVVP